MLGDRDCIHVPYLEVTCDYDIRPGKFVGLIDKKNFRVELSTTPIGVVDPFRLNVIPSGEVFRMYLFPDKVTNMKHQWTSPLIDFAASKEESVAWLKAFANKINYDYNDLLELVKESQEWDSLTTNNDAYYAFCRVEADFWLHYQNVTNTVLEMDTVTKPFTCSC